MWAQGDETDRQNGQGVGFGVAVLCEPGADSMTTSDEAVRVLPSGCLPSLHALSNVHTKITRVRALPLAAATPAPLPRWLVVRVYGPKASKMSPKACLEFVAAPQPARAAGTHRLLDTRTPWDPGSACIQLE